jgi:hypothetical protein
MALGIGSIGNKPARGGGVYGFVLKVVLWLPIFYAVWYWVLTKAMTPPSAWLSMQLLKMLYPSVIDRLMTEDGYVTIVTLLQAEKVASGDGFQLAFQINALKYSFGVSLYLALSAATPRTGRFENMVLGALFLLIPLVWGIVFETLKILAFDLSDQFLPIAQLSPIQLEFLALGYQWGSLLLPLLLPVIVWLAFEWAFVRGAWWSSRLAQSNP